MLHTCVNGNKQAGTNQLNNLRMALRQRGPLPVPNNLSVNVNVTHSTMCYNYDDLNALPQINVT